MGKLTNILLGLVMTTTTFADHNSTSLKYDNNRTYNLRYYSGTYYSCNDCFCKYDFSPVGIPNEEVEKIINDTGMRFGLDLLEYGMRFRGISENNIALAKEELAILDYTPLSCLSSPYMEIKPKYESNID